MNNLELITKRIVKNNQLKIVKTKNIINLLNPIHIKNNEYIEHLIKIYVAPIKTNWNIDWLQKEFMNSLPNHQFSHKRNFGIFTDFIEFGYCYYEKTFGTKIITTKYKLSNSNHPIPDFDTLTTDQTIQQNLTRRTYIQFYPSAELIWHLLRNNLPEYYIYHSQIKKFQKTI